MTTLAEFLAAHPELAALPRNQTSDQVIADAMNLAHPRTKVVSFEGGIGSVMRALGPEGGAAFLDGLAASTEPAVKWAMRLVEMGTLDFGDSLVRAQIDALAPGPAAVALKALAERPDPYTAAEVEAARNV